MSNGLQGIRHRFLAARLAYLRFTARFVPAIRLGTAILGAATFAGSLVCLVAMTVYFGFDHTETDFRRLAGVLRGCQILFIVNVLYGLTLSLRRTLRETKIIKWIVDLGVILTLLPLAYPRPEHPWFEILDHILYSNKFLFPVLAAYSVVSLSFGITRLLGRRTNPSLILSASFLLLILVGSLLLMMPRCTYGGIGYVDALFVSTSAVCITGLTSVDVPATFTPAGILVLAILIQTGGLGVMTFTSFFALFFSGNTSIYSQLLVRDMVYSKTMNALLPTLLYILAFTLAIELAGAAAIFLSIHDTLGMTFEDELIFSGFHSLSAFCNAGFSNIEGGLSNPLLLNSSQWIYVTVTILVTAGGIGFPILVNFRQAAVARLKRIWSWIRRRQATRMPTHLYDLNTKIVLVTSVSLTVISTLLFLLFEYDNTLEGMPLGHKIIQSWFNSSVPRSSGFSSVNPAAFTNITILMFLLLMWIGGASQSTAGGIKVNTFATMILNLKAIILGRERVTAYDRTIAVPSLRRAHAVIGLSILSLAFYAITLVGLEPELSPKALVYEAVSALFTVGSSLGVTPALSIPSKILLCTAMFLGRVGIISLLVGVVGVHNDPPFRLPTDNIIIN